MFKYLFLLFVTIPILEIFVMISVSHTIGVLPTIMLVILTAVTGTALLRQQGIATLHKLQHTMNVGDLPTEPLLEGILLLLGGVLLLTPGFITDCAGFICLIPPLRHGIVRFLQRHLLIIAQARYQTAHGFENKPHSGKHSDKTNIIDGKYRREEE